MFTYEITTGFVYTPDGVKLTPAGYSGAGADKNAPVDEDVPFEGPIPEGMYTIGELQQGTVHGPNAMRLIPDATDEMYGRAGFWMHPDSIQHPGSASEGCIIQAHANLLLVGNSPDKRLQVVAVRNVVTDPEIAM